MTHGFVDIVAWQRSHDFVLMVYRITRHFPSDERYGLTSQFRRAAVSIEANIAEGYRKMGRNDKLRFFNISQGSMSECLDYIILARDLEYITQEEYDDLSSCATSASKMLNRYIDAVVANSEEAHIPTTPSQLPSNSLPTSLI